MPTNDERREIAARLRYYGRMNYLSKVDPKRVLLEVTTGGGDTAWQSIYESLADLIEPEPERTCELEPPISGKKRCKRCGAFVSYNAVWDCFGIISARFCPNCGAKVIDR